MQYELPKLAYAYDALEPHIDKQTMEIHHTKHHQGYTDKLNEILAKYPDIAEKPLEELFHNSDSLAMDSADKFNFINNAGGYWNHKLYWEAMGPEKQIDKELVKEINDTFGSLELLKAQFTKAAMVRFGSGWAWLCRGPEGKLAICSTKNQNNPLMHSHTPIFGIDLWEHAYYLKYQNRRAEYVKNWWNVLKLM